MSNLFNHGGVPVSVDQGGGGTSHIVTGHAAGLAVMAELQGAGTLYTVPVGKTFTGLIYINAAATGAGSVTVSAATGGTVDALAFSKALPASASTSAVSIAGGGGGNVITVATSGSAGVNSVTLTGYVK